MVEVDLDALARAYRFRSLSAAGARRAQIAATDALDPLVDIGGGNGSHAAVWAAMGRHAVVVDLSDEMTRQASARPNVGVVRGDARRLPLSNDSVGLAYFHMSIHYGDWRAMLDDAGRVVRGGGVIDIWTFSPRDIERSSLAQWFPTVAEIDVARFPSPVDLAAHLSTIGAEVLVDTSSELLERTKKDWVESVRARFVSTLQFVTQDELEAGIERFSEMYPDDSDVYRSQANFTRVRCVV
jgi:ubiquinone/menaquinone biosynthesis C-methylase UbiE